MTENTTDVGKLIRVYRKIQDKRSELSAQFKEEDEKLVADLDKIKQRLLEYCKETGQDGGRTEFGTFSRVVKNKYWTSDWDSFYQFVLDNEVPQLLSKSVHQSNMSQYLEDNPDKHPPNLQVDAQYAITVRKPTKRSS